MSVMATLTYSLIVPVFRNEASLPEMLKALETLSSTLAHRMEAVFVVDGSPDRSEAFLEQHLAACSFPSQLVTHSRNFGSFVAIRTGLQEAQGDYFAVLSADLQEPPELIGQFFSQLETSEIDIAIGTRDSRQDPFFSRLSSTIFWSLYRWLVQPEIPKGGVDVFGCNRKVRDHLLRFQESNTSLVGLLFWMGFRRRCFAYARQPRRHGKSAWSFRRKLRYLLDSIFAFSDLPIHLMTVFGIAGMAVSALMGVVILIARLHHHISVPGYSATVLTIMFFGGLNSCGLGIIGSYLWRTFENTKQRPGALVMRRQKHAGTK
jgi:polyisoprenyl-phosphate glycosyltransferase